MRVKNPARSEHYGLAGALERAGSVAGSGDATVASRTDCHALFQGLWIVSRKEAFGAAICGPRRVDVGGARA